MPSFFDTSLTLCSVYTSVTNCSGTIRDLKTGLTYSLSSVCALLTPLLRHITHSPLSYYRIHHSLTRSGTIRDLKTGLTFKTTKGAPHVLLKLMGADSNIAAAVERDVR